MSSELEKAIATRAATDNVPLTPEQAHVSCEAAGCSEHHGAKRIKATAVALREALDLLGRARSGLMTATETDEQWNASCASVCERIDALLAMNAR